MSSNSAIEWTEATWNPVVGCSKVSEGCRFCYAMRMAARVASIADRLGEQASAQQRAYQHVVQRRAGDVGDPKTGTPLPQWNNRVRCVPEALEIPLRWRKPRRIFVNSMSDLFHKDVPFEFIDRVFAVMALCPQHTFQVLTKRPERMAEYLRYDHADAIIRGTSPRRRIEEAAWGICRDYNLGGVYIDRAAWPLPNVWLGASVENQETADERIPHLLKCPAAVRFVSAEPLLGPVDLSPQFLLQWSGGIRRLNRADMERGVIADKVPHPAIHWVIVGGESGPGARPMEYDWARAIISQCLAADVPCFYKQGGSAHACEHSAKGGCLDCAPADLRFRQWPGSAVRA